MSVILLHGYAKPLLYQIPEEWNIPSVGSIVQVPIRNQILPAFVIEHHRYNPLPKNIAIKYALAYEPFPSDVHFISFLQKVAHHYCIDYLSLLRRLFVFLKKQEISPPLDTQSLSSSNHHTQLTPEQEQIYQTIIPYISNSMYKPCLLHGVTGSGKTEIYKKLIEYTISLHKSVILMLPEVTLARQFELILKQQLPHTITLFGFHSGTKAREKQQLWNHLLTQKPSVIIGVHLPIIIPIPHIGLCIVDEEHDGGYQEKKHPKLNSKEIALLRAHIYQFPILLGSATPSIQSLYNVKRHKWHFFQLTQRFAGNFPTIKTVLLTTKKRRTHFWISSELEEALQKCLENGQQAMIFLNRRGFSFFIRCLDCNFIPTCTQCSVSLTLHQHQRLQCHYCSWTQSVPDQCPSCNKSAASFSKKGIGTQQLVSLLQSLFPNASIARLDMDITTKKKECTRILHEFSKGAIQILVGTQSITKGFHFPRVTLVGIVWADLALHMPSYRSQETALQQLLQVAGRAGRSTTSSTVIVQALTQASIFHYLDEQQYIKFYEQEAQQRSMVGYPPFVRIAEIELQHTQEDTLEQEAKAVATHLRIITSNHRYDTLIFGPSKPVVHTIKKKHIRTIFLKSSSFHTLSLLFREIDQNRYTSRMFFIPNPY